MCHTYDLKLLQPIRILVIAVAMAFLCACSLWRKRRQLCGWGTAARPHSQSGDSAGSCYAPPQYSRCSSFHHAPPPYTEVEFLFGYRTCLRFVCLFRVSCMSLSPTCTQVTSKPDLYPLVFSCNGHDHNKHCTGGFAAPLNNQQHPSSQPEHGNSPQSQIFQNQQNHSHHQSQSQQQLHNVHHLDDLAAGIERFDDGTAGCSGAPFGSTNCGGSSYLMVQYFRNYIVRPGAGGNHHHHHHHHHNNGSMISGASTVDSISSSFICSANNEQNTQVPPPYSRAASPRDAVHDVDDEYDDDDVLGQIIGNDATGSSCVRHQHNDPYNRHSLLHEHQRQPSSHLQQIMSGPPPATSVSSYCLPRSTSQHHVCAMDTTITPDEEQVDGERATQQQDITNANNDRPMIDRRTRMCSTTSEAGDIQPLHSDQTIYMNGSLCRSEGNFSPTMASTMATVGNSSTGLDNQQERPGQKKLMLPPQQHQRTHSQRKRLQSVTPSPSPPPSTQNPSAGSTNNHARSPLANQNTSCEEPEQRQWPVVSHQRRAIYIYHSTNAVYNSSVSIDDTSVIGINTTAAATRSAKHKRPMSAATDAKHELDRLRRSLETCCQLLEKQQHHQQQLEMIDGGRGAGTPQQPQNSGLMATSSSAVSSLANVGSPASPPRATSPTGHHQSEIKDLLQQIRQLRKYDTEDGGDEKVDAREHLLGGCDDMTEALVTTESLSSRCRVVARRPSSLTNSGGGQSVIVSAMQKARREFFGRNGSNSVCAAGAAVARRCSPNASSSGINGTTANAAAIGKRLRSPNGGTTQYSAYLLLGKSRKRLISRSAPTTPGAALPPCFLDDDSPLLNEQDEEEEDSVARRQSRP